MSETITITCRRCKHTWQQPLDELEYVEIIYRLAVHKSQTRVVKYRAQCPNDGTYIIIEVEED